MKKCIKLWDEIKYLVKRKNGDEASEYGKDFRKMRFETDDNLPLGRILNLHNLTITVRSVFQEDSKYYPQVSF